jgi:hypothetical protein
VFYRYPAELTLIERIIQHVFSRRSNRTPGGKEIVAGRCKVAAVCASSDGQNIMKKVLTILCVFLALLATIGLAALPAIAVAGAEGTPSESRLLSDSEKNFGIKVVSLRPTAGGQMLDLRFQVIDPEKAKAVLDKSKKAYVQDGKTGKTLPVPVTKAGSMRQTTPKPEAGRIYFMLFSNPGWMVKEGGSVSLLIGDFRKDGIIVDASGAAPVSAGTPALKNPGDTGKP